MQPTPQRTPWPVTLHRISTCVSSQTTRHSCEPNRGSMSHGHSVSTCDHFTNRVLVLSRLSSCLLMSLPIASMRLIERGLNAESYGLFAGPPATSSTASNL